ncbi:ECF transporter S component [Lacrimispora sp. NSJ-141]|uniref:ECF transporter S component n=1 Tax=Lientehia hominis TaxID=2897778 RepID=A0AAP2RHU1_9FIRM|nr:ECF transporter S component [Lientehia hominis]MCD2491719.1 ECF transporter S component [Lientehia hominis]
MKRAKLLTVKNLVTIAVLSAVAAVLMYLEFPLWFAPPFYEFDFSEIPVLVGAFSMGPAAGFIIEALKVVLKLLLKGSSTMGVGDWANLLIGCALVIPASMIYRKNRTKKGAVIGLAVGTLTMTTVGCFLNAYVLLPTYAQAFEGAWQGFLVMGAFTAAIAFPIFFFYGREKGKHPIAVGVVVEAAILAAAVLLMNVLHLFSEDSLAGLVGMGTAINPAIKGIWTFVLLAVAPFNLFKGVVVSLITVLIYKKIRVIMKQADSPRQTSGKAENLEKTSGGKA